MSIRTTPVPNAFFDLYLKGLKSAEIKVLLIVIRQTLGWRDDTAMLGRKMCDWISGSQLQMKTGSSRRAISSAIETLIQKNLIEVIDAKGNILSEPVRRKGKTRLFFRLSPTLFGAVENERNAGVNSRYRELCRADFALELSKKRHELVQKMHITKETLQN